MVAKGRLELHTLQPPSLSEITKYLAVSEREISSLRNSLMAAKWLQ